MTTPGSELSQSSHLFSRKRQGFALDGYFVRSHIRTATASSPNANADVYCVWYETLPDFSYRAICRFYASLLKSTERLGDEANDNK